MQKTPPVRSITYAHFTPRRIEGAMLSTVHRCIVCHGLVATQPAFSEWCLRCEDCGAWASRLPVAINQDSSQIDEDRRESGLRHVRRRTSRQVLGRIRAAVPPGARLLDVGSAHGWFVQAAAAAGFNAVGLEPDEAVAGDAVAPTRIGFFPDVLESQETFDVITFNDVLEHMEDPLEVLRACHTHLTSRGVLSVNIPSSSGPLFRVAVAARRRGVGDALFGRLWQVGLPSPHLWYFNSDQLARLGAAAGFDLVDSGTLPSLTWRGLWQRAHIDRPPSPQTVVGVAAAAATAPILNRGGDIMHLVFRRRG